VTAADLLADARALLDGPASAAPGGWPRAVALLARQALEKAIEEFWQADPATSGLPTCTKRTQLTCLPAYLEPGLAREVSYVWAALSNACHYHPYALAPTATELSSWIEVVATLLNAVGSQPGVALRTAELSVNKGDSPATNA
jgi:hypothetical protein